MKVTLVTAAAAVLTGGASASHLHDHRQVHQGLFQKKAVNDTESCVPACTTIYSTLTGPAGLYFPPSTSTPPPPPPTTTVAPATSSAPVTVPTPIPQTCPTPGTYTFPATTIVVTETITECGATTTVIPSGTHTIGGVTTVVETATTVVCPYATTKTEGGVVTSVIETTTYVCPSAGTYTIGPITTTVTEVTTVVIPVVTTYCPGTYTAPAVVTVVEHATVVYCPFTPSETPAPAPALPTKPAAVAALAVPKPAAPVPKPAAPLGGKGDKWAMTYTPYTVTGDCKEKPEVESDVKAIAAAGFTSLRLYSTDCGTLDKVGPISQELGLKLILGIFIGNKQCDNGSPTVATQISAIKAWSQWGSVELVVVANEAIYNKYCSVAQLRDLILHVKQELGGVGYKGPFTTTDIVASYVENDVSSICSIIDVVACNAHAYFNANTKPEDAGDFVASQLAIVEKICGLPGYVMETGWPTAGNPNGVAVAGVAQQQTALASIKQKLGKSVVFFSLHDDKWKQPGNCGCEQHWGCGDVFGAISSS
ncbi:glycoside hydrolase [Lasiosphaeria ovina]|uniref:Probable beta-glucosidase btgE n=1 Tax=Lasiosphaeria ovina TaxID=92902 RepID=A0AAE0JUI9_9PEZI|nr:glycoside hydrolase [Lasiosphaeria ovina]